MTTDRYSHISTNSLRPSVVLGDKLRRDRPKYFQVLALENEFVRLCAGGVKSDIVDEVEKAEGLIALLVKLELADSSNVAESMVDAWTRALLNHHTALHTAHIEAEEIAEDKALIAEQTATAKIIKNRNRNQLTHDRAVRDERDDWPTSPRR